jgi:peptide/nickel transport system substrate-binding protein
MEAMPVFSNIQIRFYDTTEGLQAALARGSIDLAWTGTVDTTMVPMFGESNYEVWQGPGAFSSSLVFVHDIDPWDDVRVRQAAALALDRQAIVEQVFPGARQPLLGPVPESVPGSLALEPERDLDRARILLQQAGYSEAQPAVANLWYVNDGRYSSVEAEYANAIKNQLEETGLFQVMVEGAPWEIFRNQKSACAYGAFLQGWPTPGQPVPYMDPMSWLYFYLESTDRLCSNYESEAMAALLEELEASEPADFAVRAAVYQRIQELWLEELPSLPLTQAPRLVIAQPGVEGVVIDAMGLLHYEGLSKQQAEE